VTPEQQRTEIAEACGWTCKMSNWYSPEGRIGVAGCPPDYLNDLNAMHEAEKALSDDQRERYVENLHAVTRGDWVSGVRPKTTEMYEWVIVHTAPAQRAEAFLKTKGL